MKPNPFVFLYKSGKILCFYNSLTMERYYLNIDNINNEIDTLYAKSFYVDETFEEVSYYNASVPRNYNKIHINSIVLLLTSVCNFNCKYCYIESRFNRDIEKYMSLETAKKIVDFIYRNKINDAMMIFYGGEPLLNQNVIKFIVDELKKYSTKFCYTIVTNGSLIDDSIIEYCKANKIHVCVSLDGPPEVNDVNRVNKSGKGTYNIVYKNLQQCKDRGLDFGISTTITTCKTIKEFIPILKELDVHSIGFNTLSPNNNIEIDDIRRLDIYNHLLDSILKLKEQGINEERYYSLRFMSFKNRHFILRHCSAYGQQVVITPDGRIGPCQGLWPEYENKINNEFFSLSLDSSISEFFYVYNKWVQRIPTHMKSCYKCPAIAICGGGCAKNAYIKNHSIDTVDNIFCQEMKALLAWSIWH